MKEPITIPPIQIEIQSIWDDLLNKYIKNVVVVSGGLRPTETFWYLAHTHQHSEMLHSVSSHLNAQIGNYKNDTSFRLLKSVVVEGFFSLRESLSGLVNAVYNLRENVAKPGSSNRILKKVKSQSTKIGDCLDKLIPKASELDIYLETYRHPYIHREDLSRFSVQDLTAAMIGLEQPRTTEFITVSYETSRWMQGIESNIAQECAIKLGLS